MWKGVGILKFFGYEVIIVCGKLLDDPCGDMREGTFWYHCRHGLRGIYMLFCGVL